MRRHLYAAALLAIGVAAPAHAQLSPERRFTRPPIDVDRNERQIYVPLAISATGPKTGAQPYDVSAAAWFNTRLGSVNLRPGKTLGKRDYTLERFDVVRGRDGSLLRVIVVQRPAPADTAPPMIRVVNPDSMITSSALAGTEPLGDGVRYTFLVRPPYLSFASARDALTTAETRSFELRLMPARDVHLPRSFVGAPTFVHGLDPETRSAMGPPKLPYIERVAGRRIEYRSGRVVEDKGKK